MTPDPITIICPCQRTAIDFRPGVVVETRLVSTQLHPKKWTKPILGQRWSPDARIMITYIRGYEDWIVWTGVCPSCGKVHTQKSVPVRELLSEEMETLKFTVAESRYLKEARNAVD